MGQIDAALNTILTNLQNTNGVTQAQYQAVYQAINDSPALLASLNADATSGVVTAINLQTGPGADFDTTLGAINLNVSDLNSDISTFNTSGENDLIFNLAHEDQHGEDWGLPGNQPSPVLGTVDYNEQQAQRDLVQQIPSSTGGLSSAAQTAWAAGYQSIGLDDEAQANISGWNAVLSGAEATNGGTLSSSQLNTLISATPQAYSLFTNAGGQITTYAGITQNADGSIAATTDNIDAAANVVANIPTSTTGSAYSMFYGEISLGWIAAKNNGQVDVSYSGLGLTTGVTTTGLNSSSGQGGTPLTSLQVDQDLSQYFSAYSTKSSQTLSLVDSDDSSTVIYTPTANSYGVDATYNQTLPAPATSVTSVTTDAGLNSAGGTVYEEVDTLNTNGILSSDVSGEGDVANLANAIVTASVNSIFTLNGSGNTVTAGSGATMTVQGNSNAVNTTGGTIICSAGDTGNTFDGDQTTINAGANFAGTVNGTDNSVYLTANSSSSVTLIGTGETISSIGNDVTLDGTGSSATITGANTIDVGGASQSLTLETSGSTIDTSAGDTGEVLSGSGFTLNGTTGQFTGTVTGGGDVFDLDAGSGSSLTLGGTNSSSDTVYASSDAVTLDGNTQVNVSGSHDTVTEAAGDSMGITGGGNTIDAGADELVWITNTGGASDTVNASSDVAGGKTANGEATGIEITSNAQVNVAGSDNTISESAGDSLGITGGGNTIDAGADELVWITNTGGVADAVDASGDAAGGETANGQATGIEITSNAQVNVTGSSDSISESAGDSLGVTGGGNTIDAGADELVWINGTNGTADTIDGSDITGGSTVNGEETGIWMAGSAQANISGSDNLVVETAGDSVGITGGGNTIDAGADELVWVNGTNGAADTIDGSDIAGGSMVNGQETGIWMADNAQADISGSHDLVAETTGDSVGITGGGNTIDAGADELVWVNGTDGTADIIDGSDIAGGSTVNGQETGIWMAGSAQATISGSDNLVAATTGDTVSITGGGNTIDAGADELVWVNGTNGVADTIDGSDITGGSIVNGQETGIWMADDAQVHIAGSGDDVTLDVGDTVSLSSSGDTVDLSSGETDDTIDGSGDTVIGVDDQISLSGQNDTIDLSHATIDVSGDDHVTIDGSDDRIVGGSSDTFTVDGTDDDVSATDSSVTFDGSNAGDYVSGSGDSGSNWDDGDGDGDGDPGSGYGYGYGLTKVKGKNPTAAQIASAEHSDSVYEGASWADKTITWSFASVSPGFSEAITNSQEQTEVEQAFQAWAKASGLKFEEVATGTPADINVDFGDLNTASTNEIGLTTYKSQNGALEAGVQVQLEDPNETSLTTHASGQLAYANTDATFEQVALHEIGHALGLADNDIAGSIMNGVLGAGNQALDATDIANIQGLYSGAPTSSNGSVAALGMAQAHLLVQAMSLFDATHMGIDNATSEASLMAYQERALASLHSSTHAA